MSYAETIQVRGTVQGVGFRPTVWRLAQQWQLRGQVFNDGQGVTIEVAGEHINQFVDQLLQEPPRLAHIQSLQRQAMNADTITGDGFHIVDSVNSHIDTDVAADAATCSECLRDIQDPNNRRFGYAFTNCTHCGPRFTITQAVPYDRGNTSMAVFTQCPSCQAEYDSPNVRRFHAQPNACSHCGPSLSWVEQGVRTAGDIKQLAAALRAGKIVAVKGIGGFHLMCDAQNKGAIDELRKRKQRGAKPFAIMAKSCSEIQRYAQLMPGEQALLESPSAPIVLLSKREDCALPDNLAPKLNTLGFMLPHSPLHHLLFAEFDGPVVATSGNAKGFAPCIDDEHALSALSDIADAWLLHNRIIINRCDDSITRVTPLGEQMIRRARGYAPSSLALPEGFHCDEQLPSVLALGGELKHSFCCLSHKRALLSQHMGDIKHLQIFDELTRSIDLYQQLFDHRETLIAIDKHPAYMSHQMGTERATQLGIPLIEVQHHHAHIASCMSEHMRPLNAPPVIGIALDGIGYGDDGNLWGGEILLADYCRAQRLAHLPAVGLPGGDLAAHEPWRNLVAHLYHCWGDQWRHFGGSLADELHTLPINTVEQMLNKQVNAPHSSSAGRLFDAVAAALNICRQGIDYEGQAAIELEALTSVDECLSEQSNWYPIASNEVAGAMQFDLQTMWQSLLNDLRTQQPAHLISARFHGGLAHALARVAVSLVITHQLDTVVCSGGVMQNQVLASVLDRQLKAKFATASPSHALSVLHQHTIPANDGGLSLGQALIAAAQTIYQHKLKGEPLCA